ncbi:putative magnesium transporter [Arachis hypogaea]|nr:putative magnesium transporter [Arachis hypogaea]
MFRLLIAVGASWKRIIVNPAGREGFPDLSMSNPEDSTLLDLLKLSFTRSNISMAFPMFLHQFASYSFSMYIHFILEMPDYLEFDFGVGGYSYLLEPLWWVGMITMIVGEIANFVAYAFAPTVLVTPLGALSIIVSAVLAQIILKEKLHSIGVLGCIMCIAGSIIIVIHAPKEQPIKSDLEIWSMATQLDLVPWFLYFDIFKHKMQLENMIFFLAELGLMHCQIVLHCPSLIAAAIALAALYALNQNPFCR